MPPEGLKDDSDVPVGVDWRGNPVSMADVTWCVTRCLNGPKPWSVLRQEQATLYEEWHGPLPWRDAWILCRDLNVISSVMET